MEKILLEWPDNVSRQTNDYCGTNQFSLDPALYSIRSGHINDCVIESNLLAANQRLEEDDELINLALAFLYFSRIDKKSFDRVVILLQNKSPDRLEVRILTLVSWLWAEDAASLRSAPASIWSGFESSLLLRLCRATLCLKTGDYQFAASLLDDVVDPPLEVLMLQAKLCACSGNHIGAVEILRPAISRAPKNLRLFKQILQHQFDAKDGRDIKNIALCALQEFGEHPQILHHCTALNLFQRQPGLARRSALLQQVWSSVQTVPIVVGNQVNAYETNGSPEWSEFLLPQVTALPLQTDAQFHSNLIMQLASSQSSLYKEAQQSC